METVPIDFVIVQLKDGRRLKIVDGEGFYRVSVLSVAGSTLITYECYIAGGTVKEIRHATNV